MPFFHSDDSAEFNQVNTALISIFKIDAKGTFIYVLPFVVWVVFLVHKQMLHVNYLIAFCLLVLCNVCILMPFLC